MTSEYPNLIYKSIEKTLLNEYQKLKAMQYMNQGIHVYHLARICWHLYTTNSIKNKKPINLTHMINLIKITLHLYQISLPYYNKRSSNPTSSYEKIRKKKKSNI